MVRSNLPEPQQFIGKTIPGLDSYVIQEKIGSGNNAHVFRAHAEELQRSLACKIIPITNLIGTDKSPPTWWQEIQKANSVDSRRVVKITEKKALELDGTEYVVLLSDYIAGRPLSKWIKGQDVDLAFVEFFLREMLDFMREMDLAGVSHGDLHAGNLMIQDRSGSLTGDPYNLLVMDFGVPRGTSESTLTDDYLAFSNTLRLLLDSVDYQTLDAPNRLTYNVLRDEFVGKLLVEDNSSFDERARDPTALFEYFVTRKQERLLLLGDQETKLSTPFDYLSCEQMGPAHKVLASLYSDRFMGLQQVEARNNTVLTGPRGCGKSTVFRSLSLAHRSASDNDDPNDVNYIGAYYRCDDLYWNFPRYALPSVEEGYDIPIHFITASLIKELLSSIESWGSRHFPAEFSERQERASRLLCDILAVKDDYRPATYSFSGLSGFLNKQRARAAKKHRLVHDPNQKFGVYWGPDVLIKVCQILNEGFQFLRDRPVYILIDDYSSPKVTWALQENLNRLLMQRSQYCFFKFATESPKSFVASDADGKNYVESREFSLVNLGVEFINADPKDRLSFIDDVFRRRLEAVEGYPVETLEQFIGNDPEGNNYNETARRIQAGRDPLVWGRRAFADLCSGDIHYLVGLASKMVTASGGTDALVVKEGEPSIDPKVQNKSIREEAGNFLRNLRSLPDGERLVKVVNSFGQVAHSYLRHRTHDSSESSPPHQASRIEPYEDPLLDAEAQEIYDNLIRYAVFIEDVRGKSRRGNVVPRLYIRRFLIPFFKLTFSKRDSIELSTSDLRLLLMDPAKYVSGNRLDSKKKAKPESATQLEIDVTVPKK